LPKRFRRHGSAGSGLYSDLSCEYRGHQAAVGF
jgi:hypothetical protein